MNDRKYRFILIIISLLIYHNSNAQVHVTIKSGIHIPGKQDQKFKHYNDSGQLVEVIETDNIKSNIAPSISMELHTYFYKNNGLMLTYSNWKFDSQVSKDVLVPISRTVQQARSAIFLSYFAKIQFEKNSPFKEPRISLHAGYGLGYINSKIKPGNELWDLGMHWFAQINTSLSEKTSLNLEAKYVLTKDVDNTTQFSDKWAVDTSGTPTSLRIGPHFDTRFYAIQLGISMEL